MKKSIITALSILLTFLILAQTVSIAAFAAESKGKISIKTAEELDAVRNRLDGSYYLENDIDLSAFDNWNPIGTKEAPFTGKFDGGNHKITNLNITDTGNNEFAGLFGYASSAEIKCIKTGGVIKTSSDKMCAGGICGEAINSVIYSCINTVDIENISSGKNIQVFLGGVIGSASISRISKCVNSGFIALTATNKADIHTENCVLGGISGFLSGEMHDSRNTGFLKVIVENQFVQSGGLVGRFIGEVITTSYNIGMANVSLEDEESAIDCYPLVGICEVFELEDESDNSHEPVINCYYLNETGNDYFGKALTKDEMKSKKSFAGFDFKSVWEIKEGSDFPTLRFESGDNNAEEEKSFAERIVEFFEKIKVWFTDNIINPLIEFLNRI